MNEAFLKRKAAPETGAVIAALILLGRYFEARSRGQASEAIEKLIDLGAKSAHLIAGGVERDIAIEDVKVGDILLVKPGEKIPVDGKVVRGASFAILRRCSWRSGNSSIGRSGKGAFQGHEL